MKAPPSFPLWPLSPSGPKLVLGMEFESKDLKTLESFKQALAARGRDYASIRANDPVSLLLDINNVGAHRLLRSVVTDLGVIFSLWKTSDAYMEAKGDRRNQLRHLLNYLFFWGHNYPGLTSWPLKLAAGLTLFRGEGAAGKPRQRLARAESFTLRLATVLTTITKELRLYTKGTQKPLRNTVLPVIKECEVILKEAEYFDIHPRPSERLHASDELQMEEAHRAEKLIVRLVNTTDRALICLEHATPRMGPLDAHRARNVFRQSEAVLQEVLPQHQHKPVLIGLYDSFLYVGRVLVGISLLPLVLLGQVFTRRKPAVDAATAE